MTIRDSMTDAISSQINEELYSSYLYFSMANYFNSINLSGFADWMEKQAAEELGHAMKFHKYLVERNAVTRLAEIAKPPFKWESPLAALGKHMHTSRKFLPVLKSSSNGLTGKRIMQHLLCCNGL